MAPWCQSQQCRLRTGRPISNSFSLLSSFLECWLKCWLCVRWYVGRQRESAGKPTSAAAPHSREVFSEALSWNICLALWATGASGESSSFRRRGKGDSKTGHALSLTLWLGQVAAWTNLSYSTSSMLPSCLLDVYVALCERVRCTKGRWTPSPHQVWLLSMVPERGTELAKAEWLQPFLGKLHHLITQLMALIVPKVFDWDLLTFLTCLLFPFPMSLSTGQWRLCIRVLPLLFLVSSQVILNLRRGEKLTTSWTQGKIDSSKKSRVIHKIFLFFIQCIWLFSPFSCIKRDHSCNIHFLRHVSKCQAPTYLPHDFCHTFITPTILYSVYFLKSTPCLEILNRPYLSQQSYIYRKIKQKVQRVFSLSSLHTFSLLFPSCIRMIRLSQLNNQHWSIIFT